jgi:hypothetical protein
MKPLKGVQFMAEGRIDEGIRTGVFFRINAFEGTKDGQEAGQVYFDRQITLIRDLERRMTEKYGDRVFVSDNLWLGEQLKIEVGANEISKEFIAVVLHFLMDQKTLNCVCIAIYSGSLHDVDNTYMGRILISGRGITIESSLEALVEERLGIGSASKSEAP